MVVNVDQIVVSIVQMVVNIVQMVVNIVQMVVKIVQMVVNIVQMMVKIVQIVVNIVQMVVKIVQSRLKSDWRKLYKEEFYELCCPGDEIKTKEMGRACGTCGEEESCLLGPLGKLGVDGKIILR
jgi:hypothetical protein